MDQQALKDLANHLDTTLGDYLQSSEIRLGELTLRVHGDALERIIKFLRDDSACHFEMLVDVCGVDYPDRSPRFDIVYNLLSYNLNQRLRIKVKAGEESQIPSVAEIYPAAGWFEREVWDLYGVFFSGHRDLRRILTDYGFDGHPLRKDFPLTGFVEVRYDDERKRVVYDPVKLPQEFRKFDFLSPWEGAAAVPTVLPGDEKADGQEPN